MARITAASSSARSALTGEAALSVEHAAQVRDRFATPCYVYVRGALEAAAEALRALAPSDDTADVEFDRYVSKVTTAPETLPNNPEERHYDTLLAQANIATSLMRHAGRAHEVCTADGLVTMQMGRDLTRVSRIIGTGGYLANTPDFNPSGIFCLSADAHGKRILAPRGGQYHRDPEYLFPLLANIAKGHPVAAVQKGLQSLTADS